MRKLIVCCSLLFILLLLAASASAQAVYAAGHRARLQFGGGGLALRNDYSAHAAEGVAIWGDYDFSRNLGVEGAVHFGGIRAPDRIGERSYAFGPRVVFRRGRMSVFGTLVAGQGTISNQRYNTASTYNLFGYGGGLEYLIAEHLNLRLGDVEVQRWHSFPPHGLAPLSFVVGVSYVLF